MGRPPLPTPTDVLAFWFGSPPGPSRPEWFRKDAAFDARIRSRFGELHEAASRRELEAWRAAPEPMLALVVVLDQFSRNMYRGDARAFAQDEHAFECANEALARGDDASLLPVQRQFLYLPLEHSEDLADQERCVAALPDLDAERRRQGLALATLYRREAAMRHALLSPRRRDWLGPLWTGLKTPGLRRKSAERALKLLVPRRWFGRR